MFRATMYPSSGETTVFMWHLVLVILYGWLSGMHTRQSSTSVLCACYSVSMIVWYGYQSSTQNNKYQVSHKHSCFCWWRGHSRPKHVEIDKYTYLRTYSMVQSPSWEANWFAASQEIHRIFMEPEGSLPHSQASANCPYPVPAQSTPHTHIPPPGDPS